MGGRLLEAHFQTQKQAGEAQFSSRLNEVLVHGCLVLGFDKQAVFGQVANEGMVFGELKMGLNGGLVEQGPHVAQTPKAPRQSGGTGLVNRLERVLAAETDQANECALDFR